MEICLTMIVKNEGNTIKRCLEAAKPFITSWAICDTGSTDNTIAIIGNELKDIPGALFKESWVNFSHNRSLAFNYAQTISNEKGYALLLDADHELKGEVSELLQSDGILISQKSSNNIYPNIRLIKTSLNWKCIGVTHEYWSCADASQQYCDSLYIIDHEDGGSRGDKFERDERLLRQGLLDEPNNERYVFYLAQTLEDIKPEESLKFYLKRAAMGGYEEERWMACYRAAKVLLKRGEPQALLKAWESAPHRAEPLYWLANYYRNKGDNYLAVLFAEKARQIPTPQNALFVERQAYEYGPDEEISISGFYTNEKHKGLEACERCIEYPQTYNDAHRNIVHYTEPLFRINSGRIKVPELEGYSPGTVSIYNDIISVRMLNYVQIYGRHFKPREGEKFLTKTRIFKDDKSWIVDDSIINDLDSSGNILGLEDWRLFTKDERIHFTANCCMIPGKNGQPQVVTGMLSEDLTKVIELTVPKYGIWCEKNWQAFSNTNWIIYSYDPYVVLELDGSKASEVVRQQGKNVSRWRGSSPPILINNYHISIVHDVIWNSGDSDNVYLHRFVAISNDRTKIIKVSAPFFFDKRGIEYTAGMQLQLDNIVKIVYSVDEFSTRWLEIPVPVIFHMLGLS